MSGSASMKSAATDGRCSGFAFKDERTNAKVKRSEPEMSGTPLIHEGPEA
ncbi:hypothetical protein [Dokdonella immobilis]|uniref:Uncharacterized protein n=1 Tax=Dokdonella immobilis TaxID=578942 RepID=A0A1I4X8W4_9GAMM|nr:hypothetical protein [Dokdonella immobilis]SFN22185.1 hypothetical protein SAMN05216289_10893 [Dokdonella immobilis]